eukprot:10541004-Prorocentrum_lima.AAC.1
MDCYIKGGSKDEEKEGTLQNEPKQERVALPPRIGEDERLALKLWLRTKGEEQKASSHEEVVEKVHKAMAHAKDV